MENDDCICLIPLTRGLFARVSPTRYRELSQWKWHAKRGRSGFYAERGVYVAGDNPEHIKMSRQILGLDAGDPRMADHINGDTLDNRDENLRVVTASQNAANSKHRKHNTSGHRGVFWHKASGKWCVRVRFNNKHFYGGYFSDLHLASEAQRRLSADIHAEFKSQR